MGRKQGSVHVRVDMEGGQQGGHRRQTYISNHDDRGQPSYYQPPSHNRVWRKNDKRVSFQDRGGGGIHKRVGGHKQSRNVFKSLSTLAEDDQDMNGGPGTSRRGGYSTRGGFQRGRARIVGNGGPGIRKGRGRGKPGYINHNAIVRAAGGTLPQARGWHRVTIRKGPLYPKNELLSMLVAKCPVPFAPISFTKEGNANCFYVESKEMATALTGLYEKIIMSDGSKLGIMARPSPPPKASHPDGEMLDKLKTVMSSRFVPETKALNLRKFYADPQFLGEPFYAPLNRSLIMNHIIKIIGEHIPGIEAIDLSENDLRTLDDLEKLVEKAPNVKILYLSKNNISNVKDFIMIKDWKLVDLKVDNNPLIDKLTDYIGAIRTVFPSIITLDGAELPKLITFDDDDTTQLPSTIIKQSVAPEAESLVLQFLEQYLRVFDSENREPLVEAYHADAVMSMSTAYPLNSASQGPNKLSEFIIESRNLFEVNHVNKRMKQLHTGKLSIVAFLNSLPKTETDMSSLTLDIPFATERLMTFTVTGLFKQRTAKGTPIRHFNRVFLVVPQGAGFVIVNEMLYITTPTPLQLQTAFKAGGPPQTPANTPPLDANAMQMRCSQFSEKTGMNLEFCKQCLELSNWDLDHGYAAFLTAKNEGKIPPEAFLK